MFDYICQGNIKQVEYVLDVEYSTITISYRFY